MRDAAAAVVGRNIKMQLVADLLRAIDGVLAVGNILDVCLVSSLAWKC